MGVASKRPRAKDGHHTGPADAEDIDCVEFYQALPRPVPAVAEHRGDCWAEYNLSALDDLTDRAFCIPDVRNVPAEVIKGWKAVLKAAESWITPQAVAMLCKQYSEARKWYFDADGAPHPGCDPDSELPRACPFAFYCAKLKEEMRVEDFREGLIRSEDGGRKIEARQVPDDDIEAGLVPESLYSQNEALATCAIREGDLVAAYGGLMMATSELKPRSIWQPAQWHLQGAPGGRPIPAALQQFVADTILAESGRASEQGFAKHFASPLFEQSDAELLLHPDFLDAVRDLQVTAVEWQLCDEAHKLFVDVPNVLRPSFCRLLAKVGSYVAERYTADTSSYGEYAFADLTVSAHCFGKASAMINDCTDFCTEAGDAATHNVKLQVRLVEGMPVVLVVATRDLAPGERLLLSYDWLEKLLNSDKDKVKACLDEVRMSLRQFRDAQEQLQDEVGDVADEVADRAFFDGLGAGRSAFL